MRQIGTLPTQDDAQRFAAYLLTQGIAANVEAEEKAWVVWVRNEDQLEQGRQALEHFRAAPHDSRYQGVEQTALKLQRDEEQRRREVRKNVVEMRGKWSTGPGGARSAFKQAPLTCVLIGLSIFVGFLTGLSPRSGTPTHRYLGFSDLRAVQISPQGELIFDGYAQIRQGQVWRLVTPIFLHFSLMHLGFNMLMLYSLGTRIEARRGAWRMGLLVLFTAICSNVAQNQLSGPAFGGMSGVVYALVGFIWMKMIYDPGSGLAIDRFTLMLALIWLFGNMLAEVPPFDQIFRATRIANTAHFAGLVSGMLVGVAPLAWRKR